MFGIYFANRWVRRPRPEDSLDKALKAFDDNYHIFHYTRSLPCDHFLLTPTGLIALEVVNLNGAFFYRNGRWKEAMTVGRALRYIVEERVSDPVAFSKAMDQELKAPVGSGICRPGGYAHQDAYRLHAPCRRAGGAGCCDPCLHDR